MNTFRSEHEGLDIMMINNWFEASQDEIEKSGGQKNQLLIMLFWAYLTVPLSEFQDFVIRKKESWEKDGGVDGPTLIWY